MGPCCARSVRRADVINLRGDLERALLEGVALAGEPY